MGWKIVGRLDYVLGKEPVGRALEVYPDDVFLVSYPKSGNTWVRVLFGNLIRPEETVTLVDMRRVTPDIYRDSQNAFRCFPRPRVIKSHECFDPRYRRVIYIVRDPRDVAISLYHFERKKGRLADSVSLEAFTQSYLTVSHEDYGTWKSHALSWLTNASNFAALYPMSAAAQDNKFPVEAWRGTLGAAGHGRQVLLVRYEQLLEDTARELTKMAKFLGMKVSAEAVSRAVELSTADRLKKLEASQADAWVATRGTRKDIPFIRAAKAQQWVTGLPAACIEAIETAWGPLMQMLGYQLSSQSRADAHKRGLSEKDEAVLSRSSPGVGAHDS